MNLRECALVAFTLLMQASVGIVLVLTLLPLVQPSQPAGSWPSTGRLATPLGVAVAAAVLALLASLLHLGQPVLAWLALANLRGSWLSREILLAIIFVAALAATALGDAGGRGGSPLHQGARVVAVLAGLAVVFAMARLYMIAGQPVWNRLATPVTFFASTFLLGLAVIVALVRPALEPAPGRLLVALTLALLALQALLVPGLLARIPGEQAAAVTSVSVGHAAVWLAAGRIGAALASAAVLVMLLRGAGGGARYAALALVVVSEIIGRVLFYATSARL